MPKAEKATAQKGFKMKGWGDAKRGIFEDILLYSATIVLNLCSDLIFNLGHAVGIVDRMRPVSLGAGQMVVAVFFGVLLLRKISQWRYYS